MSANATKALAAVIRHEIAAANVASLQKRICESLRACPVHAEMEQSIGVFGFDQSKFIDGSYVRTHLHEAMKETVSCDSGYGDRRMRDDEIEEWLADGGCEHCLQAWRLVMKRKEARRELGFAKQAIRAIGRAAVSRIGVAP